MEEYQVVMLVVVVDDSEDLMAMQVMVMREVAGLPVVEMSVAVTLTDMMAAADFDVAI